MQVIAFHVADQLAVEVELVQVAAAVVQVIQVLAGRQGQRGQVAQWIVVVGQGALWRGFLDQTAQQVVGKIEFLFADAELFAVGGGQALDAEQAVCVVVGVVLTRIGVELGQQSADWVALKFGMALWAFAAFAVADFIHPCQVPAEVVAELAGQVVDALLFNQPVGRVVGELVGRIVFVDQRGQADGLVVFIADALALGVLAAARQTAGGAQQACGLAFAVGVRQDLAEGVVGEEFSAAVRVLDAQRGGDGDEVIELEALNIVQGATSLAFGYVRANKIR